MQFGKLVWFEVKKAVWNKFFVVACVVLLIANTLLWCPSWIGFGQARRTTFFLNEHCKVLDELTKEELQEFERVMKEIYGEEVLSPLYIMQGTGMELPGYLSEKYSDAAIIGTYTMLLEQNARNMSMNEKVLSSARQFGREAVKKGKAYEIRRNLNIIRRYSEPREEIHYIQRSWDEFAFKLHPMLLVQLLVLLVCAGIFTKEKEQQTELILHTTKNGKRKTLAAKYIAVALCAIAITILFQIDNLAIMVVNYGFLGFSQPVTAIEELALCPYTFTVGEYVMIAVLLKVWATVLMALLFGVISLFSKNSVISYALGITLLAGSMLLLFFPPECEVLAGPLTFLQNERYFSSYYTANLFGYPVLWLAVQIVVWIVLTSVCIFASGVRRKYWCVGKGKKQEEERYEIVAF